MLKTKKNKQFTRSPAIVYACFAAFLSIWFHSLVASAEALSIPGYNWQDCPKVSCSLLVPNQWKMQVLNESKPITFEFAHNRGNKYSKGLLNVMILQNAEQQTGMSAAQHLQVLSKDIGLSGQVLNTWKRESDIFSSVALTAVQYAKKQEAARQQFSLLVVNKETGTLYVINFQAPIQIWTSEWRLFERTFAQLRLDHAV